MNHWQEKENSGNMLTSKLKGRLVGKLGKVRVPRTIRIRFKRALRAMKSLLTSILWGIFKAAMGTTLPDIHKNPFEVEEAASDDFTAQRMVNVLSDSRFFRDLDAAVLETLSLGNQ